MTQETYKILKDLGRDFRKGSHIKLLCPPIQIQLRIKAHCYRFYTNY